MIPNIQAVSLELHDILPLRTPTLARSMAGPGPDPA